MTIDEEYKVVTMWDVQQAVTVHLHGRIKEPELLSKYLAPEHSKNYEKMSAKAQKLQKTIFEDEPWEKLFDSLVYNDQEEYQVKEDKDLYEEGDSDSDKKTNGENSFNEDDLQYSDELSVKDVIVQYDDLNQNLKGNPIDIVGVYQALGRKERCELKRRNQIVATSQYIHHIRGQQAATTEGKFNFFEKEKNKLEEAQKKREDRHVLPQDFGSKGRIVDVNGQETKVRYGKIGMIFSSKNIWVNLQYHNPNQISYDLWDGLVRESKIPHVRGDPEKWEKWDCFLKIDKDKAKNTPALKELNWGEKDWQDKYAQYLALVRGLKMEHFQTYYVAKAFDKQISPAECREHERVLTKEIVNNIRHKGSSINILVQFYP